MLRGRRQSRAYSEEPVEIVVVVEPSRLEEVRKLTTLGWNYGKCVVINIWLISQEPAARSGPPISSAAPCDRGADPCRSLALWNLPTANVGVGVLVSIPGWPGGRPRSAPAHVKQRTQSSALCVGNVPRYVGPNGRRIPPTSTPPHPTNPTFCLSGKPAERAKSVNVLYVEQGIEIFSPYRGDRSDVSFAEPIRYWRGTRSGHALRFLEWTRGQGRSSPPSMICVSDDPNCSI